MGPIILMIHSIFRWIVVIVGIVTFVKLILGVVQKSSFTNLDRRLTLLYSISVDIEVLLGILTLILLGFNQVRLEHAVTMVLALIAVHIPSRWRSAPDAVRFCRNTLISFAISLVLIFVGVSIVNGWVG